MKLEIWQIWKLLSEEVFEIEDSQSLLRKKELTMAMSAVILPESILSANYSGDIEGNAIIKSIRQSSDSWLEMLLIDATTGVIILNTFHTFIN